MKQIRGIIIFVIAAVLISVPAYASEEFDAAGGQEIIEQTPNEAQEILNELNINEVTPEELLKLKPTDFFKVLFEIIKDKLTEPLVTLMSVVGIVILSSLLSGMKNAMWENTLSPVFGTVSILSICTAITVPIISCIKTASQSIFNAANFTLTFIPIFSGIVTVSGQPITAGTYTVFLFGVCQIISQIAANTLVPLLSIYLAFCIIGGLVPSINISGVTNGIKTLVCWGLGLMLTIFVGLLTVQSMLAGSADTVALKASKFLISSFVPVVGGALSDAFIAAQGCVRLLKASVGAYGILIAALTFLPILIQMTIWVVTINICSMASEVLETKEITGILKSISTTLTILIAIVFAFALLIIVSTTLVLMVGGFA